MSVLECWHWGEDLIWFQSSESRFLFWPHLEVNIVGCLLSNWDLPEWWWWAGPDWVHCAGGDPVPPTVHRPQCWRAGRGGPLDRSYRESPDISVWRTTVWSNNIITSPHCVHMTLPRRSGQRTNRIWHWGEFPSFLGCFKSQKWLKMCIEAYGIVRKNIPKYLKYLNEWNNQNFPQRIWPFSAHLQAVLVKSGSSGQLHGGFIIFSSEQVGIFWTQVSFFFINLLLYSTKFMKKGQVWTSAEFSWEEYNEAFPNIVIVNQQQVGSQSVRVLNPLKTWVIVQTPRLGSVITFIRQSTTSALVG